MARCPRISVPGAGSRRPLSVASVGLKCSPRTAPGAGHRPKVPFNIPVCGGAQELTVSIATAEGGQLTSVLAQLRYRAEIATSQGGPFAAIAAELRYRALMATAQAGERAAVEADLIFRGSISVSEGFSTEGLLDFDWVLYSECKDELQLQFPVTEGDTYQIQIADDEGGPWYDHVVADAPSTGLATIRLNNDYEGLAWFRVVTGAGIVREPRNPDPSIVAPPDIAITNVTDSAHLLRDNGGFTIPYSIAENGYIQPSEVYIVPRGRKEWYSGPSFNWDGTAQIVSITGEAGATHKWTRDGTDPTIDTVIKKLDGFNNNLAVYRTDFPYLIRARSFKDGCQSPMTLVLVDKRQYMVARFTSAGFANTISGACDLPKTGGAESGASCNVVYGGIDPFECLFKENAVGIALATPSNTGRIVWFYNMLFSTEGPDWAGWMNHHGQGSFFLHNTSTINRQATFWDVWPRALTNYYMQLEDGDTLSPVFSEQYKAPATDSIETIVGPDGAVVDIADTLSTFILNELTLIIGDVPPANCLPANSKYNLRTFDALVTAHDDFGGLDGNPPVVLPPDPPPTADPNIGGDDFETYALGDTTLDEGTLWTVASLWVFNNRPAFTNGFDDFENGTANDGGIGWATDWTFNDSASLRYGDDFQSYAAGDVTPFMIGGTGFVAAWVFTDYSVKVGQDNMQSYSNGQSSGLNGGTHWAGGSQWTLN